MKKILAVLSACAVIVTVSLVVLCGLKLVSNRIESKSKAPLGQTNSSGGVSNSCKNLTTYRTWIGKDVSNRIVATSSRAWTRIQMDLGATTTAELTFLGDASSTSANATVLLNSGSGTSSSSPFIDFGLNTFLPYTGSVQGLSTFGTSTVVVTQCSY